MLGLVFVSRGFPRGTAGYNMMTAVVAGLVIAAVLAFVAFVGFEVYRSVAYVPPALIHMPIYVTCGGWARAVCLVQVRWWGIRRSHRRQAARVMARSVPPGSTLDCTGHHACHIMV